MILLAIGSAILYAIVARGFIMGNSALWALYGFCSFILPFAFGFAGIIFYHEFTGSLPVVLYLAFRYGSLWMGAACSVVFLLFLVRKHKKINRMLIEESGS